MTTFEPLLVLDNITKNYGAIEALKGISFTIGKGEVVATFRLPSDSDAAAASTPRAPGLTSDAVEKLLSRVTALETELEMRYEEEPRSGSNGSHGSGAEAHGPDEGARDL